MNWKRIALYALVYAVGGAALGALVAVYTEDARTPAEESEWTQRRAAETYQAPVMEAVEVTDD